MLCLCYVVSIQQPGSGELVFMLASRRKAATLNAACLNKLLINAHVFCLCAFEAFTLAEVCAVISDCFVGLRLYAIWEMLLGLNW